MIGRGIFQKMKREMEKDCKDWYQRQQKGGRVRKRKPKNKREQERNVNPGNRQGMVCGQD